MKKCGCSDSAQDPVDSFLENALTHFRSRTGGKTADLQQDADAAKADKKGAEEKDPGRRAGFKGENAVGQFQQTGQKNRGVLWQQREQPSA